MHAHHFLSRLDRVPRVIADEALDLYRDAERMQWILELARVPRDEERVAISLGDDVRGPFVIVTRNGRFVTCLAEGMVPHGLRVVRSATVAAITARLGDNRDRRELAREMTAPSGHSASSSIEFLFVYGEALTREEFRAASAWEPPARATMLEAFVDSYTRVQRVLDHAKAARRAIHREQPRLLEAWWKRLHALGHLALFIGMRERVELERLFPADGVPMTMCTTSTRHIGVALRGIWAAARCGGAAIPLYAKRLATSDDPIAELDAVMALTAIGARREKDREAARAAIRAFAAAVPPDAPDYVVGYRTTLLASAELVLDDPMQAARIARRLGACVAPILARGAPPESPWAVSDESEVSDEHADLTLLNYDLWIGHSVDGYSLDVLAVALIATRAPEDFYMPEAMHQVVGLPFLPVRATHLIEEHAEASRAETVRRATRKLGRNEPCACGSGKKVKRCCGA
jgi:hypothetical protein